MFCKFWWGHCFKQHVRLGSGLAQIPAHWGHDALSSDVRYFAADFSTIGVSRGPFLEYRQLDVDGCLSLELARQL